MRKKKSAILEAVYETATDLHKAGLMNQTTLREFEHLCLFSAANGLTWEKGN